MTEVLGCAKILLHGVGAVATSTQIIYEPLQNFAMRVLTDALPHMRPAKQVLEH